MLCGALFALRSAGFLGTIWTDREGGRVGKNSMGIYLKSGGYIYKHAVFELTVKELNKVSIIN